MGSTRGDSEIMSLGIDTCILRCKSTLKACTDLPAIIGNWKLDSVDPSTCFVDCQQKLDTFNKAMDELWDYQVCLDKAKVMSAEDAASVKAELASRKAKILRKALKTLPEAVAKVVAGACSAFDWLPSMHGGAIELVDTSEAVMVPSSMTSAGKDGQPGPTPMHDHLKEQYYKTEWWQAIQASAVGAMQQQKWSHAAKEFEVPDWKMDWTQAPFNIKPDGLTIVPTLVVAQQSHILVQEPQTYPLPGVRATVSILGTMPCVAMVFPVDAMAAAGSVASYLNDVQNSDAIASVRMFILQPGHSLYVPEGYVPVLFGWNDVTEKVVAGHLLFALNYCFHESTVLFCFHYK